MTASASPRRTKVAYLVPPTRHFAGVERVVHEVATGLAESHADELDVHVIYASDHDEEVLRATSYTQHTLGVTRLRKLAAGLRRCCAREDFDVVVCPQVEASVLAWLATRGLGLPAFVTHLHGNPRVEEDRGSLRTRGAFWFFRAVLARRIAGVFVVSPSLGSYVRSALTPRLPVRYVPNPVRHIAIRTSY